MHVEAVLALREALDLARNLHRIAFLLERELRRAHRTKQKNYTKKKLNFFLVQNTI